ncbi:MAG: formate/nitrite transporter family protein [Paracoccaceae bacterium]
MANQTSEREEREQEEESVTDAKRLSSKLIYEVIRRDGEDELRRPMRSLLWSGIAAGMMISFSVLGEAILRVYLPKAGWAHLVESLGYSIGFLLVILGRMQLFTENTITTVLPVVGKPCRKNLIRVARLWSLVLAANILGVFLAASFIAFTPAFEPQVVAAVAELSRQATGHGLVEGFFRAMPAGVLVASIVWMLPTTEAGKFSVILLFTWLIAAGNFTHVIAGSVEMAFLVVTAELPLGPAFRGFFLPVLLGNVVGGTMVFTMLAWGQVKSEVDNSDTVGRSAGNLLQDKGSAAAL